jgi:hypothetical protein
MHPARPFDAEARAQTARWLETWARNGPLLEARRVADLRQLTDEVSAWVAVDLVWPMAPSGPGDDGAGLRPLGDALRRLAGRQ